MVKVEFLGPINKESIDLDIKNDRSRRSVIFGYGTCGAVPGA